MEIKFFPSGDEAVTMEFGRIISEEINDRVLKVARMLEKHPIPGVIETVPTYRSLLVVYDKNKITYSGLCGALRKLYEGSDIGADSDRKRIWLVPCCYGAHFGPDLDNVAVHSGLSPEDVIEKHCSTDYRIYMMGFLPGFVYLGGMDPQLAVPRLKIPRLKIPRGAVGIGGNQTGIYPMASPGGWQLIGNTPLSLYSPDCTPPVLFQAGDYLRFVHITLMEYYDIRQNVLHGIYVPEQTIDSVI